MPHQPRLALLAALTLASAPRVAIGQDATVLLDEVVIEADSTAPNTARLEADTLARRHQGAGLPDMLRNMAGVTTQGGTGDEAETAVNIRGLQDHGRVAVTLDGMRQNFARSGHGANGSFNIDSEMLREVAVTRGAGAGAGAIAGALAMRSVTAEDLLTDGQDQGGELRLRYGDLTASPTLHGAYALRLGDAWDLTLAATRSEKADYTAPDGNFVPAAQTLNSGLATLGLTTEDGQRLTLGLSRLSRDYTTGRSSGSPRAATLGTDSLSLGYEAEDVLGGWSVTGKLYDTATRLDQQPLDAATLAPTGLPRSYDTATAGLLLTATRSTTWAGRDHDLSLRLEGFRDRVTTDDPAGASLTPSGQRQLWSLALEDRIALDPATLTLGLSLDSYRMRSPAARSGGEAASPRLALDLPLTDSLTLHGAASLAYRPPALSETLVDGLHPEPADFPVRPNPGLTPERARMIELALAYQGNALLTDSDSLTVKGTIHRTLVQDYIGMEWVGGVFDGFYQYQNLSRVKIKGLELEASYEADRLFVTLAGQALRGTVLDTGAELSRSLPDRLTLTTGYRSPDGATEIGARFTHSAAKTAGSYATESWKTVDLFLTHDLTETASLGLTLNNIFDETYIPHLETQTSPGFNAQASLTLRF